MTGVQPLTAAIAMTTPIRQMQPRRRALLQLALRLENQPARAEKTVAEHPRHAREDRKTREAVDRASGEHLALDRVPLDEGAVGRG